MAARVAGFYTAKVHYMLCSTDTVRSSWFYGCNKCRDKCNVNDSKNMGEICAIAYCQLSWFRFMRLKTSVVKILFIIPYNIKYNGRKIPKFISTHD